MATKSAYTPEMVELMVATYDPKADEETRSAQVAELVEELGFKSASVIAKLSSMGIYVPKIRRSKDGSSVVTKEALVAKIAAEMSISVDALGGMEKATKPALKKVLSYIRDCKEAVISAAQEASDAQDTMEDMAEAE